NSTFKHPAGPRQAGTKKSPRPARAQGRNADWTPPVALFNRRVGPAPREIGRVSCSLSIPDLDLSAVAGAVLLAVADAGDAAGAGGGVGRGVPLGGGHVQAQLGAVPEARAGAQCRAHGQLGQLLD